MTTIYGLRAIGDTEIRYVGLTNLPIKQALKTHKSKARNGWGYGPADWIAEVGDVEIVALRICASDQARKAERHWVEKLYGEGHRLLNSHLIPRQTGEAA